MLEVHGVVGVHGPSVVRVVMEEVVLGQGFVREGEIVRVATLTLNNATQIYVLVSEC